MYSTYTITPRFKGDSKDFKYEIKERYGVIGTRGDTESKELNLVKYGDYEEKYDLRTWRREDGQEKLLKGLTMSREELIKLKEILDKMDLK